MSNYTSAAVPESSRVVIDPVTRIEGHLGWRWRPGTA